MPIYSANRTGISAQIAESVNPMDIGAIMYESQLNDMAIFEAVIRSDYGEVCRLREGTMLECEIQSLTEGAVKEFFKSIQDKLAKFWAKIKRAFNEVIDRLAFLFGGNGKKTVAAFNQQVNDLGGIEKFKGSVEVKMILGSSVSEESPLDPAQINAVENIRAEYSKNNTGVKGEFGKDYIEKKLGKLLNKGSLTAKEFADESAEKFMKELKITKKNVAMLTSCVAGGAEIIKRLKASQKKVESSIYEVSKELKKAEYAIENNNDEKINIRNISNIVSAYETIVAIQSRTSIAMVKQSVKNARKGLMEILAEMRKDKKEEKAYNASAILVAESEVDDVFSGNLALFY